MPSIAELLLAQGAQAAETRRRLGEISGQMWGNIGNTIAQIPGQMQQQQQAAQTTQLRGLQLDQAQREAKSVNAFQTAMSDPNNYKPDGSIDEDKIGSYLRGHDIGAYEHYVDLSSKQAQAKLNYTKTLQEIQASQTTQEEKQRQTALAQQEQLGRYAYAGQQMIAQKPDDLVHARDTTLALAAHAVGDRLVNPDQAKQFIMQTAQSSPEQLSQTLGGYVPPDLKAKFDAEAATTSKTKAEAAKLQAEATGTLPPNPAQAERIRHDKEMERISGLTQGREAARDAETQRHNRATEAANNPLAALGAGNGGPAAGPAPPAGQGQGLTGDAFLKTLPPSVANEVKAYAEGRRPFPAGFALKAPYFQSLIQMVGQYDPTFDAVNYNARSKTRNDFTSGKSSQTINALNTVTQHLNRLSDSADALSNSWSPVYNTVANFVSKQSGNKQVTQFETDKKAVVDELTRAWRQAGGSEGDIKSWSSVLDAANSPTQLHGAIAEMGHLLEGKLSALQSQYQQGMGTTDTTGMQVVTPEARSTLSKLEARAGGGPAQELSVKAPNGKTYTFKSQADLDAFKKAAGL
jgi:hypothetical protein